MPSERQLQANRRTAARGGPKTDAGRAAVRFNALKHGLTASSAVLPGEDAGFLKQLRADLNEEYEPATPTEHVLVEEFVRCSWRLLRLRRVETEMWTGYINALRSRQGADRNVTQQESDRAVASTLADSPASQFNKYFRYERGATRDFYRALDKLEDTQRARRRGQRLPAPVADAATSAAPSLQPCATAPDSAAAAAAPLFGFGIGTVSPPLAAAAAEGFQHEAPQPGTTSFEKCTYWKHSGR
jgi:hypothetical protein